MRQRTDTRIDTADIARCGNRCDLCPLYVGNFNPEEADALNDSLYKYHYGSEGPRPHYTAGCDGCRSEGTIARPGCAIRACVIEKRLNSCAQCPQLYCQLLEADMTVIQSALAQHRASMPQADFDRFFRPFLIRETLARLRQET